MGTLGGRTLCVLGVLLLAACGGRQGSGSTSVSSTSVSSGGAALPESSGSESHVATPEAPAAGGESDDELETVEMMETADEAVEDPPRRDLKMVSYEEAMARPVEIGDASFDGGEAQLTADEVARFMDEHLDEMYEECIQKEMARGNELGTVTIDLAIRGADGMVLGTTIEPGRRRFKKCLESYLEDVRFPKFASPRMGARYTFHTS